MCGYMCGRDRVAVLPDRGEDRAQSGDPAVGGRVHAVEVHGVEREQRLRVVRAALLVAHRDGRRDALPDLAHHLRVTGRHDVLEPADVQPVQPLAELDRVGGRLVEEVGVDAQPRVRERLAGRPQPRDATRRGVGAMGSLKRRQPWSHRARDLVDRLLGPIDGG